MAKGQNQRGPEQIPDSISGEIKLSDFACIEAGRTSGPPQPRTVARHPKQWQLPKNESTPNRRIKRT